MNHEQLRYVNSDGLEHLVIGNPGTGKTITMIERIRYLGAKHGRALILACFERFLLAESTSSTLAHTPAQDGRAALSWMLLNQTSIVALCSASIGPIHLAEAALKRRKETLSVRVCWSQRAPAQRLCTGSAPMPRRT